jgi:Mg-chelatase subunit ChlD
METPVLIEDREQPVPRLVATQQELTRLISGLDATIAFDLVTFRDEGKPWKDHLLAADERNRHAALAEVDGYRAWGPTNVHGALEAVFDMAERALDAASARDEDLDTLFVLSDGVPTSGTIRDPELLLQYVAERNRVLRLRIHCLSLTDEASSRDFLQRLASLTGGQYVELVRAGA